MQPPPRVGLAAWCSLLAAVLPPAAVVLVLFPLVNDMPSWDQWSLAPVFEAHASGRPVLPLLLAPYNGHYNCLPRALFYGLGLLSRWDVRLEVLLGYLWAAATLVVLLRMLWETRPRLLVLAAPFAACVFSVLQFENFLNGYCMGQLLAQFSATLALYLLTGREPGPGRYALALLASAAAYLSYAASLALAPVGLLALLCLGGPRLGLRIAGWLAVSACGVGLGLAGKHATGLVVVRDGLGFLAATLLGRPFTASPDPSLASTAVSGCLALVVFLAVLAWRLRTDWAGRRDVVVRWGGLGLLSVGAALLIALGRSWIGPQQGLVSHYVTATYPLELALLALIVDPLEARSSAASGRVAWLPRALLLACCAAPLLQHALAARRYLPVLRANQAVAARNAVRLALGTASDRDIQQSLHPDVALVRAGLELIRSRRLAWFAHAPEAHAASGGLESVSGLAPAARVRLPAGTPWIFEGWAVAPLLEPRAPLELALFVDGANVARTPPNRPRPELAAYYGGPGFLMTNFAIADPDGALRPPGRYRVRLELRGPGRVVTLRSLEIVVASP